MDSNRGGQIGEQRTAHHGIAHQERQSVQHPVHARPGTVPSGRIGGNPNAP